MGRVFTLSGPSGVGKTTFLRMLLSSHYIPNLKLLPRYTDRPKRDGEEEGFEYNFTSSQGMLQKLFANDFIHIEKWGNYYSAIETRVIEDAIASKYDGIILASTFGTSRLRATYGLSITPIYMWPGQRLTLLNPRCMESNSPEVIELKWRIRKKLIEDGFSDFETASLTDDDFLEKRMVDNYLDIAAVNGRLRAGEDIIVLSNLRDCLDDAVVDFQNHWSKLSPFYSSTDQFGSGGCFVLMPFKDDLWPIYNEHISKVCNALDITVKRADQIFSVRPVMEEVLEAVVSARFIIADLTDKNPNVLYEVGICHALGKDVILITQHSDIPFDLRHLRYIEYENTKNGLEKLETMLANTLIRLLNS